MATQEERREQRHAERKQRIPLGVPRQKLTTPQREGYIRRWVCDRTGRLQRAEEGGYQFVTEDIASKVGEAGNADLTRKMGQGSKISQVVGTHANGQPMMAYLMEIKKEWYDEDQKAKNDQIKETEKQIFRKPDRCGTPFGDGQYTPLAGTSMDQKVVQKPQF